MPGLKLVGIRGIRKALVGRSDGGGNGGRLMDGNHQWRLSLSDTGGDSDEEGLFLGLERELRPQMHQKGCHPGETINFD